MIKKGIFSYPQRLIYVSKLAGQQRKAEHYDKRSTGRTHFGSGTPDVLHSQNHSGQ